MNMSIKINPRISKEFLEKEIRKRNYKDIEKIVTEGEDLQNNYTPPEICNMMLSKLDLNKNKSILILYTVEILYELKKLNYKGSVTFFTQSLEKKELAKKLLPGVIVEYIDIEENPLMYMEKTWPEKFDIIISNPPYSRKLDLKFLDKAMDISKGEIVFVHPSTPFVDGKGTNNMYNNIKEKLNKSIISLELFNGNGIFNIGLYVPCCITHLNKNSGDPKFKFIYHQYNQNLFLDKSKLEKISIFGYREEFVSINNKIKKYLKYNNSLQDIGNILGSRQEHKKILKNNKSFFVEFSHITAGVFRGENISMKSPIHKSDFFILISKYQLMSKEGTQPKYNIWFEFETEAEANNFLTYLTTDFARMCLALSKVNQNLYNGELKKIPAMDFTQEWTDEKLYKHFNISKEEQAFIKEVIPNWYD